jgi:hypothetical protein
VKSRRLTPAQRDALEAVGRAVGWTRAAACGPTDAVLDLHNAGLVEYAIAPHGAEVRLTEAGRDLLDGVTDDFAVGRASLSILLVCSFRYALGRRTYVVTDVANLLRVHADALTRAEFQQIADDIDHAIAHKLAGDDCDVREWRALREWIAARYAR